LDRLTNAESPILMALAVEVTARGYQETTVDDVIRKAGVTRREFDASFASKEDCFLRVQRRFGDRALAAIIAAAGRFESWPRQVEAGVGAFLDCVCTEPDLAHASMVEALSAGPAARRRHEESLEVFASLLRTGRTVSGPTGPLPDTLEEAIVGGIFWIIYQRLVLGRGDAIEDLCPKITEFALAPYAGVESARRTAFAAPQESPGAKKLVT
jgi:AcrR family transcriptional regulator